MKAGERDRVTALRLVLSELQKAAKEGETDEVAVLQRERKKRAQAETAYREAGREEQAAQEALEAQLIEVYLPTALTDPELILQAMRAGANEFFMWPVPEDSFHGAVRRTAARRESRSVQTSKSSPTCSSA